jgi:inner membrane protein
MPTIFTHAIIPIAAGFALGRSRVPVPVLACGIALSMLPDADVIGFRYGIPYADQFGHRGASHAIMVAAVTAALLTAIFRRAHAWLIFVFLFISMASHGLLDALTNGGLGPALFWPFDTARYFAPYTPIRVSPVGMGFFSSRGVTVILSEMQWVWLPAMILAVMGRTLLRQNWKTRSGINVP